MKINKRFFFLALILLVCIAGLVRMNMGKYEINQSEIFSAASELREERTATLSGLQQAGGVSPRAPVYETRASSLPVDDLSLIALFETHDIKLASAVVLAQDYGAYRYFVGGMVAGRYRLDGIYQDHVVLSNGEDAFRLYLAPLTSEALSGIEGGPPAPIDGEKVLEATRADRERTRLLTTYDLYPVSDNAPLGYIIGERFPPDVLRAAGAKPGDIVISVNGYAVGHPESDELALTSFRNSMKASVLLRRADGSSFYFNYPEDEGGGA